MTVKEQPPPHNKIPVSEAYVIASQIHVAVCHCSHSIKWRYMYYKWKSVV